jgi:hypothetical protein
MLKRHIIVIVTALVAAIFLFSGCQIWMQSKLDRSWSSSFEAARSNQIMNLDAGIDPAPVTGLDGSSAEAAVEKYRGGFKKAAAAKQTTY